MKIKLKHLILVLVCFFSLSFSIYAAPQFPNITNESDYYKIGTFLIKDAPENVQTFYADWKASSRNLILSLRNDVIAFVRLNDDKNIMSFKPGLDLEGDVSAYFGSNGHSWTILKFKYNARTGNYDYLDLHFATSSYLDFNYILGGTYFESVLTVFNELSYNYVSTKTPLMIEDDYKSPDEGWQFPDFLQILKDAFIPPASYFNDWFAEVQNALLSRTGGLSSFFTHLQQSFNELKNFSSSDTSLNFSIPKNHFFNGFTGVEVNLLSSALPYLSFLRLFFNGVIVIFTGLIAYKTLIKMFEV